MTTPQYTDQGGLTNEQGLGVVWWPKAGSSGGGMPSHGVEMKPPFAGSDKQGLIARNLKKVLSTETGFRRDYGQEPYAGYAGNPEVYFPVCASSRRFHPKARVLGLAADGRFKAYPFAELSRTGHKEISGRFAGLDLTFRFDRTAGSARGFDADGRELAGVVAFWFAWFAFHPETEVFSADKADVD